MKTIAKQSTVLSSHIACPIGKAVFVPHEQYTADSVKAMRHLAQAARTRNAPAYGYAKPNGYDGAELKPYLGRPDANDTLRLPSRMGNRLRYPDGRITDLAGNLLDESRSAT